MAVEIVALEGDQTGQELLEEGLRVLSPDVIGVTLDFPRYDLNGDGVVSRAEFNEYVAATDLD